MNCEYIGDIGSTDGTTWTFGPAGLDGYDEFAVTNLTSGTSGSTNYVVLVDGRTGDLNPSPLWNADGLFGISVTGGLDVWRFGSPPAADHIPDIVIGYPSNLTTATIRIYSGADPFGSFIEWPPVPHGLGAIGEAVALLGDVTGNGAQPDGLAEILIGAPNNPGFVGPGIAYVKDPTDTTTAVWKTVNGLASGGVAFGRSLSGLGDIYDYATRGLSNTRQLATDTFPEFIVSDPKAVVNSNSRAGYFAVYTVAEGALSIPHKIDLDIGGDEEFYGSFANAYLGYNVTFTGLCSSRSPIPPWVPWTYAYRDNINGTMPMGIRGPVSDSSPYNNEAMSEWGHLMVGSFPYVTDLPGVPRQLAGAPDMDQDGYADIAVVKDVGGVAPHAVEFWSWPDPGVATLIYRIVGYKGIDSPVSPPGVWTTVSPVGDQDGDGNPDVAIVSRVTSAGGGTDKTVIQIWGSPVTPTQPDPPRPHGIPRITGNTVAETGRRLMIEIYNANVGATGKLWRSNQLLTNPINCGTYQRWVDGTSMDITYVDGTYGCEFS
ncbi:MAG: hypothetical protein U1E76_07115 [Planctomycetota bacterium]